MLASVCGGKIVCHQLVELVGVLRHADGGGEAHDALARKAGKIRIEHRAENLAHAVGAEVEAQHAVAVLHAAIVADHRRHDELVEFLVGVGIGDRRRARRESAARRLRRSRYRLSRRGPSACRGPWRNSGRTRVAIVTDGGSAASSRLRSSAADCGGVSRPSVKRMHQRPARRPRSRIFGQRRGMILMRMHAARRDQAEQMAGAAARFELLDEIDERRRARDLAAGDRGADARQILHHHAAGADIEMADFGIAHLAVGQADVLAGGVQKAVRQALPQPVEGRRLGLADGVVRRVLAPAPAVQNDQHNRASLLHCPLSSGLKMNPRYGGSRRRSMRRSLRAICGYAAPDLARFPAEHGALAGDAPVIAGEFAGFADDAVARHHEARSGSCRRRRRPRARRRAFAPCRRCRNRWRACPSGCAAALPRPAPPSRCRSARRAAAVRAAIAWNRKCAARAAPSRAVSST